MNELVRRNLSGELIPPTATVRVVGRSHPLRGARIDVCLPAGLTVRELVKSALASSAANPGALVFRAWLDGHPIEAKNWDRIRLKPGAVLTFAPVLQGNNGLRTVLGVAVAIAALVIAGPVAGALGFAAGSIGFGIASAVISAGVMLAGTLALNALFPVKAQASSSSIEQTNLNFIAGAQNQAAQFGAIPVVLGRHRQSPFYGAKPYTEISGNDQYLRLVFCLGYGPLAISDLKIGETPIEQFDGVQVETRQGFAGDGPLSLYPGEIDEQSLSIKLSSADGWQTRTTSVDTDEISLDFLSPNGCYQVDDKGNVQPYAVTVQADYAPFGSGAWSALASFNYPSTVQPARYGVRVQVPRGQYDVRVRKVTADNGSVKVREEIDWTALRSFKSGKAITFPKPLALVAMRIKATGQLSGVINTFNCVTTSLVKAFDGAAWHDNTASQNPADLYRHVLQGPANARAVADEALDLESLQSWWSYCNAKGFKYNRVITSAGSVYDQLAEIAAAGRAVPSFIDGRWGVVWDQPDAPIVQHFSPRNSWGFRGDRVYAQAPHGWRVKFINEANGYTEDERRVYDDGYDETSATLFEQIEFPGVTDPALIWRHGRFHIAQSRLRPETITLQAGWENIVCTRGDRVAVTHDVLMIGLASGRVKSVAGQVVTIDELVTIESGKTYGLRFRVPGDSRSILRAVDPGQGAGETSELTLVGDLSELEAGTLFGFGETGQESAIYRVKGVSHARDLVATLTLVDDAPEISTADQGAIPAYSAHVSLPPDPYTLPPQHLACAEVIDGVGASVRALARLSWSAPRRGIIASSEVQMKADTTGGDWVGIASLPWPIMTADVPTTAAGIWSFRVRFLFTDGTSSAWSTLSNLNLLGLSLPPSDVANFRSAIIAGRSSLAWDPVVDARPLYYEIRKGASWESAQVVGDNIIQSPWQTVGEGTYYIAAFVVSPFGTRVYSDTKEALALSDSVLTENVVVTHDEGDEGWIGYRTNCDPDGAYLRSNSNTVLDQDVLAIADILNFGGNVSGQYASKYVVNVGRVTPCRVSVEWDAVGVKVGDDILASSDVLSESDILGSRMAQYIRVYPILRTSNDDPSTTDLFAETDFFNPEDVFLSGVSWSAWRKWSPDYYKARLFQLGMRIEILDPSVIAYVLKFRWTVDVPDRLDRYLDLSVPSGGLTINFTPDGAATPAPFMGGPANDAVPHLLVTLLQPTDGDKVVVSSVTKSSCVVQITNGGSPVARDHVNVLAQGY